MSHAVLERGAGADDADVAGASQGSLAGTAADTAGAAVSPHGSFAEAAVAGAALGIASSSPQGSFSVAALAVDALRAESSHCAPLMDVGAVDAMDRAVADEVRRDVRLTSSSSSPHGSAPLVEAAAAVSSPHTPFGACKPMSAGSNTDM